MIAALICAVAVVGFASPVTEPVAWAPSPANDREKQIAQLVARKLVVDFLSDHKELAFEDDAYAVTAKPIDPAEKVKVEVEQLTTGFGSATGTLKVVAPLRIEGKVKQRDQKQGGQSQQVACVVQLALTLKATADVQEINDSVTIQVNVEEFTGEAVEVTELEPADFPTPKEVIDEALHEHREKLREWANSWLRQNPFEAEQNR